MLSLGKHQKQLEADHATLCAGLGIERAGIDIQNDADIISDLIKEKQDELVEGDAKWAQDKAQLLVVADALKQECS